MSGLKRKAAAMTVAAGLVLAACGGDDDDDTAATSATTASTAPDTSTAATSATTASTAPDTSTAPTGTSSGDAEIETITSPPTEMTVTEPLPETPEPKTVAWVNCEVPACQVNNEFFTAAAEALGWKVELITYTFAAPGAAFQQAIDSGVDYIATSGVALAQIEEQVALAEAQGIPIFECYSTDVPAGEENNLYAQCAGLLATDVVADTVSNWIIDDSGGDANVLMVTIRDFPILVAQEEAAQAAFSERCPDCTTDVLSATIEDLGAGAVPQQVASYVQSNPDVDYIWFLFSNVSIGVSEALDGAGLLEGRNLVGTQAEVPQLQEIVDGTNRAWSALPFEYAMWILVDQMARHATGVWSLEQEAEASVIPTWVVDTPEAAAELLPTEGWHGPDGFQDHFKELWGVAG
jgi:ribose transport system substrate-binding protein